MRRRTFAVPLIGAAILVAGCSSSKSSSSSSSSTTSGGGETRTVKVDNSTPQFNGAFLEYFPNQVTVHPGDTVNFAEQFSGEPHSVTFGTLVEKGLAAAKAADPNSQTPPPDLAALPTMLPQGPGDADQRAVNPCFVDSGALPTSTTAKCADTTQPDFTGKQAYYNSGFLEKGAQFTMKLASDIAPGTYHWYCNLHGPDMSGTLTVVPAATPVPSASDVDAAGASQLAAEVAKMAPDVAAATGGKPNLPIPVTGNLAGLFSQSVQQGQVDQFFPATIKAKVGAKVSWTVLGAHTITFGAPSNAPFLVSKGGDGGYHIDATQAAPIPAPTGPPPTTTAAQANAPSTQDGGTYSGSGEFSSGIVQSFPPALVTWSMTFSKAGTYNYVCLIHPGMVGQVVVS